MNRDVLRQWITMLTIVVLIGMNVLANALPLNGLNTGQISDTFKVFFVPAGYVFSIWFLIYVGLLCYGVYQALPAQKENPRLRRAAAPFVVSSVVNIAWLFFWHYGLFTLTAIAMVSLLVKLDPGLPESGRESGQSLARRALAGAPAVQHLSRLDQRGDHRQHHQSVVVYGLEWLRPCARSVGGDHAGRGRVCWRS